MPNVQQQVLAGAMKGLAVTGGQRWSDLAQVPTFGELGFPDINLDTGHFLLAPAGTPPSIVALIAAKTLTALARPEVQERLHQIGYVPISGGPDVLRARMAREVPLFKQLVADAHIHPLD
jgi:tripartite-type tricarboxylate transporter receptor subunit TctC